MSSDRKPVVAVVCTRSTQFEDWCRENDLSPRDQSLWMVTEVSHVQGFVFDQVVDLGGRPGVLVYAQSRLRSELETGVEL